MDNFREEVVVRRNPGMYNALYYLTWFLIVIVGLFALMKLMSIIETISTGQFSLMMLIVTLLAGGLAFLLWRNKDELRTEYEYALTNGELDVAKVMNNSKRKYLTNLQLSEVEACGEVASPSFQRYVTMKDVKKHNWFLNRDSKLYYFYFTKKGTKHLIVLELSDEMAQLVKSRGYLGFGIWQN